MKNILVILFLIIFSINSYAIRFSGPYATSANISLNFPNFVETTQFHTYSGAANNEILIDSDNSFDSSLSIMESSGTGSDSNFGTTGNGFRFRHDGSENKLYIETGNSASVSSSVVIDRTNQRVGIGEASPTELLEVNGNIEIPTANYFIMGPAVTDGSWRFRVSGNNLVFERRESSAWVNKGEFTP